MNIKFNIIIVLVLQALFFACKTTDKVLEAEATIPNSFRGAETNPSDTSTLASVPWRTFFTDSKLIDLIDTAIANNYDLQIAIKNMETAQLLFKQAKAGYYPDLNLQIAANSSRPSDNSLNGISLNQFLGTTHIEDYTTALALSWEADVWGKIRNQKAIALASYLQSEEAKKAVQTQLVSSIAKGYYNLLMLREQLDVAKQNLALTDSTLHIIKEQYDVGEITLLGLEQAEAQRLAAASLVPEFEQRIATQENAIQLLTGKFPSEITPISSLNRVILPEKLTAGVPSALLSRRPDVKSAEIGVLASNAQTRLAQANMYPSLTITAQSGVNAFTASNWFNVPASLFGMVAGSITQPILQRRQLKTQHETAKIEQEKSVIKFKQSVLTAVGEVSDALIAIDKLEQRESIALNRTTRLQNAINHAGLLFETGMANYLEIITAQENVLQSELELAGIKKAQLDALVDLYRSLGGGWE
ncbi:efflux transporter outer membrane subunit [Olivibacter sp. SDN3]|uniref:efflux transporter outer membrane subunit n=1 Tax=Olivibacter sp. SDN3 TaxID=2764720 RepID=UPI001650E25F|nr:efflux transporter outer membrane subunit [Olivibacter sp. SDN3]QNL49304.1 efflux transporter outer membrane subunit [Olivibacter sp. SDN3]